MNNHLFKGIFKHINRHMRENLSRLCIKRTGSLEDASLEKRLIPLQSGQPRPVLGCHGSLQLLVYVILPPVEDLLPSPQHKERSGRENMARSRREATRSMGSPPNPSDSPVLPVGNEIQQKPPSGRARRVQTAGPTEAEMGSASSHSKEQMQVPPLGECSTPVAWRGCREHAKTWESHSRSGK